MKKILSICFLVSLFYNATAQQIFQKSYYVDTNAITQGASFVKLSNGDYLCVGLTGTYLNNDTYLLRTDSLGNIIWSKTLSTQYQDRANNIAATEDSNFIITGFHFNMPTGMSSGYAAPYLIKINENGNILWSKNFIDTGYYHEIWLKKTISLNNSYYSIGEIGVNVNYGTGTIDTDTMKLGILIKTDATGNVLWAKQYGVYKTIFNDFTLSSDTNFMVVGYSEIFDSLSYNNKLLYLKVDTNGNVLWSYKCDAQGHMNTILNVGNGYLLGGVIPIGSGNSAGFIIKIGESGNVIWSRKYGNNGNNKVESIVLLNNNKIVFSNGSQSFCVADSIGNNPIYHGISNSLNGFQLNFFAENDGGLSAFGLSGFSAYFFKTDSNFFTCVNYSFPFQYSNLNFIRDTNLMSEISIPITFVPDTFIQNNCITLDSTFCQTYTNIFENNIITTEPKIYPNPCNDHLTLEINNGVSSNYNLSIKDLTGRVILSSNETAQKIIVDTHQLNSGIYFLYVKSIDESWTKKFIKL